MWSAMAYLGEMTALLPIKGPIFEFPRHFVDRATGYAVGWMAWFVTSTFDSFSHNFNISLGFSTLPSKSPLLSSYPNFNLRKVACSKTNPTTVIRK